jgi:hypothetical protein
MTMLVLIAGALVLVETLVHHRPLHTKPQLLPLTIPVEHE